MDINELRIRDLKEIKDLIGLDGSSKKHPFEIGENYLIRTVTMIQLGKLIEVFDTEIVLDNAVWIADTGRFNEALAKGVENVESSEIEIFNGKIIIGRGAIVDACTYSHNLPTENK